MGGEKFGYFGVMHFEEGSPPRGRGKARFSGISLPGVGITPAWAGKRFWNRPWVWATSDHPRVGGEKPNQWRQEIACQGSSPRGRGKGKAEVEAKIKERITPAWAGKSALPPLSPRSARDHPRMGGEKRIECGNIAALRGSPPHGRGKGAGRNDRSCNHGITPAWAGKSYFLLSRQNRTKDHPRMGGEKMAKGLLVPIEQGSPPHGRGKDTVNTSPAKLPRITPAWAGKSQQRRGRGE